ncbi:hypothetical protein Daus18300_006607 [Diaporthe australafricana]|uniref:F-box domain-containing protein n=1 Tax=Diaporthe australafricana TaxID=127596 RepID=A0ABR3WT93_9PEZI
MANNKANNEADINGEEVLIDTKVDAVKMIHAHRQQTHSDREEDGLLDRHELPQGCESTSDISQSPLLDLPPEIRNKIYFMVLVDIPRIIEFANRPAGEFSLRQPALAKANRQLRHEILPIFYHRSFGIRIYPKTHSEVDKVWKGFLDSFAAMTVRLDGVSILSRIQSLEVELWHPAFRRPYRRRPRPDDIQHVHDHDYQNAEFPLYMSDGIYLQFGALPRHPCERLRDEDTDWTNRASVKAVLERAIEQNRRIIYRRSDTRDWDSVWRTYPFERLVDLSMMIAAECEKAARVIRIGTSFAPKELV